MSSTFPGVGSFYFKFHQTTIFSFFPFLVLYFFVYFCIFLLSYVHNYNYMLSQVTDGVGMITATLRRSPLHTRLGMLVLLCKVNIIGPLYSQSITSVARCMPWAASRDRLVSSIENPHGIAAPNPVSIWRL